MLWQLESWQLCNIISGLHFSSSGQAFYGNPAPRLALPVCLSPLRHCVLFQPVPIVSQNRAV
jgi:hypothetical protein